ncbi:HPr family phosphocarrier protein [Oceanirhabdus sp. W0125-5]|uniref:HPr family phosphocarrier protein n=1 Tax=Oceanirhabdus sp. W0125-5 TaxID=2999116 RepID=UPI0022F31DEC|nr:HPr family phosphocarrier protein [Oceanirhabdus sp. W0125-5]WBW98418.1 HPr family phosphocarrier protein [Oceanirhabdus sp. W0125-5]
MNNKCIEFKVSKDLQMAELIDISEKLSRFMSDVSLKHENKNGNMKSIISLMAMNIKIGDTVIIEAVGSDCEEAVEFVRGMME